MIEIEKPLCSVMSRENQLMHWVEGFPIHNGYNRNHGMCCPDFSCCRPELLANRMDRMFYFISFEDNNLEQQKNWERYFMQAWVESSYPHASVIGIVKM